MMSRLACLCFFSAAALTSAEVQEVHPERSMSIESSAHLSNIAEHGSTATAGRRIEKAQGDFERVDMSAGGVTLMEGVSLGEASSRTPAGLIRRELAPASHRSATAAGSALEEEAVEKHAAKAHKASRRAVSWEACENGQCVCGSRRRMVIRYQRERKAGSYESQANTLTNWHFRVRQRPYANTSIAQFNKGFTQNANNLQMCGGDKAWAKDCLTEPQACTFDTEDSNPYDAKAGEYCCSGDMEYCSYKCQGTETFKCPTLSTDINFPGGMDPAGADVFKRCYMAQYPHGMNPESATDADLDVGGNGD